MNRGNRRFMIGTMGLALLGVCEMAAWSPAAPPAPLDTAGRPDGSVTRAVGSGPAVAAAARAFHRGNDASAGQVVPVSGGGLINRLFGGEDAPRSRSAQQGDREPVDWDGIPYHQGNRSQSRRGETAPIRDPGAARRAQRSRGGAPSGERAAATRPSAVPTAPRTSTSAPRTSGPSASAFRTGPLSTNGSESANDSDQTTPDETPLSRRTSSRRSSRRPVEMLVEFGTAGPTKPDTAESAEPIEPQAPTVAAAPKPSAASNPSKSLIPEVPKVASRVTSPETGAGQSSSRRRRGGARAGSPAVSGASTALQEIASRIVPDAASEPASKEPGETEPGETKMAQSGAADAEPTPAETAATGTSDGDTAEPYEVAAPLVPRVASSAIPSSQQESSAIGSGLDQSTNPSSGKRRVASFRKRAPAGESKAASDRDGPAATFATANRSSAGAMTVKPISGRENQQSAPGRRSDAGRPESPRKATAASEVPGVRVVTEGAGEILVGESHPYEIRVENRGSLDADDLTIQATIPAWAQVEEQTVSQGKVRAEKAEAGARLVWNLDQLSAGESERLVVQLQAARSGRYQLDVQWSFAPRTSSASVQVHQPKLEVTIEGPDEVVYGRSETYQVHVRNPGDGVAPNVLFLLSPDSPKPQTQRIGDIPPGKEAVFEIELNARQSGDMKIHGQAAGDMKLSAEAAKTVRVATAELEAVLAGPGMKYQSAEASYQLELENKGSAASEDIAATLTLPAGVEYLGGIDGAAQQGTQLTWQLESLAAGESRQYEFRCNMAATGAQRFEFACQGSAAGKAAVSIDTEVSAIADLVLSVNDPAAPAPVGKEVVYEITVRNRGSKAASDVEVVAQFSHGIEPQRVEGQSGEVTPGQALFDAIEQIAAGDELTLRVIAKAERAGHHRFRSEVRSGDTVLVSEEATHYMASKGHRVSRRSSEEAAR